MDHFVLAVELFQQLMLNSSTGSYIYPDANMKLSKMTARSTRPCSWPM